MTFAFSTPLLLAGALGLALTLAALQFLKARRRTLRLPAAALWAEAARTAPPRALFERFRHWLAYFLVLAIALCLWFAAARPETSVSAHRRLQVFYLDASAGLTPDRRFSAARTALLSDVRATAPARRVVFLGEPAAVMALKAGENAALLSHRLGEARPGARASSAGVWASRLGERFDPAEVTVRYYGDSAGALAIRRAAPNLEVIDGYVAPPTPGNRGVVNLGVMPAASGQWDRADIGFEAIDAQGRGLPLRALDVRRDGAAIDEGEVLTTREGRYVVRDVPADGGRIEVRLRRGDAWPADDAAALRLPDRTQVRVATTARVPQTVRRALAADTAVVLTDAGRAEVLVRTGADAPAAGKPELVIAPDVTSAFVFSFPADPSAPDLQTDPEGALKIFGLAAVDAGDLADRLERPVGIETRQAPTRSIQVWSAVVEDAGFSRSAAFPLFVSHAVRWLAPRAPWSPYVQAGQPMTAMDDAQDELAARSLGGVVLASDAGTFDLGAGRDWRSSLVDREQTLAAGKGEAAAAEASRSFGSRYTDILFALLILAAAALLVLEWRLTRRGRMA